jgi:hypothetical protein
MTASTRFFDLDPFLVIDKTCQALPFGVVFSVTTFGVVFAGFVSG